ncbi:MAG: deoxyribodipyrimidine photo-lyase [Candidatus Cloacimonetes bacterium]|nr:deoxyribodipyrimidine photo-lyase [Candidatus Cloacimonadota bacterium]
MQQSQRVHHNLALDKAILLANERKLPLVVLFCLREDIPDANFRHYQFMLEGLKHTWKELLDLGSLPVLLFGDTQKGFRSLISRAAILVMDTGYLRFQKSMRADFEEVALEQGCPVEKIETDVIVPVEIASDKEEYAAVTLRPKLIRKLPAYLTPPSRSTLNFWQTPDVRTNIRELLVGTDFLFDAQLGKADIVSGLLKRLDVDRGVKPVDSFTGGYDQAVKQLESFIKHKILKYSELHSDPGENIQSNLSPYLHFGQISPLEISIRVMDFFELPITSIPELIRDRKVISDEKANLGVFFEELIIRRELSMNFCHYNPHYDSPTCLPKWASITLNNHLNDPRPVQYSLDRLEHFETDDIYWNAAQKELVVDGKMHNYMRMYWGKKILEWSADPDDAYSVMLYLNNKYSLDGRDPNSYTGIAWCLGKHDRPWNERTIFGTVRYMNFDGLKRKFSMHKYLHAQGWEGSDR